MLCSNSRLASLPSRPQRRPVCARCSAHEATPQKSHYVAMNVFKVKPESGPEFEAVWKSRESRLKQMPGFVRFAMLKCENVPGKYISQSTWESKEAFEGWTRSSQFAASHGSSSGGSGHGASSSNQRPSTMSLLEGPPSPELFTTVTITE
ncbi:hypothetical protein Agub_g9016 [Astrephomene gubernaculifera]|uniref:ABM domain-containing protein n=1 Tax=Astrephomene gubernaculifera TaxID=47775 RepID=A0AAD3DUI9_9CHLO|nr:hypothetical protein Agub_g9016 [Astrephomene gubernaculifera]